MAKGKNPLADAPATQANSASKDGLLHHLHTLSKKMHAKFWTSINKDTITIGICVHALFRFPDPMDPNKSLKDELITIARIVSKCTLMSWAPVENVKGNLFADAILASLEPECSSYRDGLWDAIYPPPATPSSRPLPPRPTQPPSRGSLPPPLPLPRPTQQPTEPQPVKRAQGRLKNLPKRPPTPPRPPTKRSLPEPPQDQPPCKKPSSASASPEPEELASGYLLTQLLEAEFDAKGTDEFRAQYEGLVKLIPRWVLDIIEAERDEVVVLDNGPAAATLSHSMLTCLQILAHALHKAGRSLYFASLNYANAVGKGLNTIKAIHDELHIAHEHCRGMEPIINSFRFIETGDTKEFQSIGLRRAAQSCSECAPPKPPKTELPKVISCMNEFNLVKRIYMEIQRASDVMRRMEPKDGLVVDWDGLCRAVGELKDILYEGTQRCAALLDFIRMEGAM